MPSGPQSSLLAVGPLGSFFEAATVRRDEGRLHTLRKGHSDVSGQRLLYLLHSPPLPAVSGERLRALQHLRALERHGWRTTLFALGSGRPPTLREFDELRALCDAVEIVPFDVAAPARFARLVRDVALRRPFQSGYFVSRTAKMRLKESHGPFDLALVGQLYMVPYLPPGLHASYVLDSVNVESRRLGTIASSGRGPRALAARLQAKPADGYERRVVAGARLTLAVSRVEYEHFDRLAPGRIRLVPNGVDTVALRPREALPAEPVVLFSGSLGYAANVDAVRHLIGDVLPFVRTRAARALIVGADTPRSIYRAARASTMPVAVTGYVPTLRPYVEQARVLAVPLRAGGGTRLKILEALAQGLPVVATTIGCEGLGLEHERDALIADDPKAFATCLDRALTDDELCRRLASAGRATVERHFDSGHIGDVLDEALVEAATTPRAPAVVAR
jgi:glycosyltransferase involved in cell wall biosynthesis